MRPVPNLIVLSGLRRGTVFPVEERAVLGRQAEADLRLPDFLVSARHAEVAAASEGWVLRDLGSTNGTFRNGLRLGGPQPLALGDLVQLGTTELLFTDSDRPPRLDESGVHEALVDAAPAAEDEAERYAIRVVTEPGAEDLLLDAAVDRGLAPDIALSVAQAVQGVFGRAWDLDDLIARIAERFVRAARGRGVAVALLPEGGGALEVVYRGVVAGDALYAREEPEFAVREDLLERALEERGALLARAGPDAASTGQLPLEPRAEEGGEASGVGGAPLALCLALPSAVGTVGVVYVHDARPGLTQEDLGLLSLVARLAGVHLRDHLLVRQLRTRNAELEEARAALARAHEDLRERFEARTAELADVDRRRRLLARIVDSSPDAVVSLSLEGVVTSWNPGAEALYGYTAEEVLGEVLPTVPDERSGELKRALREVGARRPLSLRTTRVTRDDREVPVSATVAPVLGADGEVEGLVEVARDLSEQLAHEERMRWRERLDGTAQLARGLAHELGNPLANLRSGVDFLLARDRPEPVVRRGLEVLRQELLRLQRLAQRAFDLTSWETPEVVPVDLRGVLADAAAAVAARARDAGVEVRRSSGSDPARALGDRDQLMQVALNLLANALDHTPRGGRVELGVLHQGERVGFAVRDSGRGIAPEDLPRVWDPFFSRRADGAGIGLAIVRRIVDLHGGELSADSEPGDGTVVAVLLPAERR